AQPDDHQQSQWLPRLECLPYHQQRQQQQQEELQQQQKPLGQQPDEQKQPQQEQNVASGTSHAPLPPPPPPTLPSPPVRQCSVDDWRSPLSCDGGFAPKQLATLTQSPLADVADSCGTPEVEVALGKFDALHLGHRSLAIQAAKHGAYPLLLSFWGMAQVLGWPPRLPLVAPPDRPRVLASWQGVCGGRAPRQRLVPFREIRGLSPAQFVELLAHDLGVAGVVAGSNYRFGFRAQGDAGQLRLLGEQHGLRVSIMQLLHADPCTTHSPQHTGAHGGQHRQEGEREGQREGQEGQREGQEGQEAGLPPRVASDAASSGSGSGSGSGGTAPPKISSSQVRELLAAGDMTSVALLLGRPYRLVMALLTPPDPPPPPPPLPTATPPPPPLGLTMLVAAVPCGRPGKLPGSGAASSMGTEAAKSSSSDSKSSSDGDGLGRGSSGDVSTSSRTSDGRNGSGNNSENACGGGANGRVVGHADVEDPDAWLLRAWQPLTLPSLLPTPGSAVCGGDATTAPTL
ncbi:hypothetical protein QJQ45_026565, partial [Haematococcus lacustris]